MQAIQNAQRTRGLGRLTRFLKEWSGAGAAVAIILAISTQWTGYVEFRTRTNDFRSDAKQRLERIEERLGHLEFGENATEYYDCEIDLDHPFGEGPAALVFIRCIIRFHGGSLPQRPMVFRDCLFQFDVTTAPSPRGRQTMQILAEALSQELVQIPRQSATHS